MKSFLAIPATSHEYRKPGRYRISIFEITDNIPRWITSATYQPASTRGVDSEAMNELASQGIINQKYTGYYHDHSDKDFHITVLSSNLQ